MISPRGTEHPHGTQDILPRYSWYPPTILSTPHGTAHTLYRVISKVFKPPTSRRYFERIFGVMEEEEWRNIYTLTAKVTVCTSLRIFQYKILNNILYLNARLFKMHMMDSGLCSLCNSAEQSMLHLFLECRISSALWLQVQSWCTRVITLPDLSLKIIYFGINSGAFENLVLNNHITVWHK